MDVNKMSGCELSNLLANTIGLTLVKLSVDNDEMLKQYSDDELIENIINGNDRDVIKIIIELYDSILVHGDPERDLKIQLLQNALSCEQ